MERELELLKLVKYKKGLSSILRHKKLVKLIIPWYMSYDVGENSKKIFPRRSIISVRDLVYFNKKHPDEKININVVILKEKKLREQLLSYKKIKDVTIEPIKISQLQHDLLKKNYVGTHFEKDKDFLLKLYAAVGIDNNYLSIPPGIFSDYFELFGSPLNTINGKYCSMFEFEKLFSSSGNFFNYSFGDEQIYTFNPPFDNYVMEKGAQHLEKLLDETDKKIVVIVTLPIWDKESQKELGLNIYGEIFYAFDILTNSKYFFSKTILNMKEYKYFSYFDERYIAVSYTHLIVLKKNISLKDNIIEDIKTKWREIA